MRAPIYLLFLLSSQVFALWPVPVKYTTGSSVLWIAPNVKVTYTGGSV
jgi:hypothetical protein